MPYDPTLRVSPELSELIERVVNDPMLEEPPTLATVREAVEALDPDEAEAELLHPQERASAVAELDELIDEYGEDAPAVDFIQAQASEALTRVIEAMMDTPAAGGSRTLAQVRDALASGIAARLTGDGVLDPDEDAMLAAEIEALIERFGPDAPAEEFIRLE